MLKQLIALLMVTIIFTACNSATPEPNTPLATPTAVAIIESKSPLIITVEPTRAISVTGTPLAQIDKLPTVESILTPDYEVAEEKVTFKGADGLELHGTLFGQGQILVVIASAQNETALMWAKQAKALANQGFLVLTYEVRDPNKAVEMEKGQADLRAAIEFGKSRGATQHILIGSGDNSLLAIKVAAESQAKALVLFSPPLVYGNQNLTADDLQKLAFMPKLFVDSQNSPTQANVVQMFEWAENPKTWGFFPGTNQGAKLYDDPENGPKIINFMAIFFLSRLSK